MDKTNYIKTRVDEQINWMEGKSKTNQSRYKLMKAIVIIAAAAIPFLAGIQKQYTNLSYVTGALGVLIVVLNGVQQLNKYKENWIGYRITIEALRREKMLFENNAGAYKNEDAFTKFVENIEALLANENKLWQTSFKEKTEQKK